MTKAIILSEKAVCKWLGASEWQLKTLRSYGMPAYSISRELRVYNKQHIIDWITVGAGQAL